ncbi:hypothetical protein BDQ12DRAFT_729405 [Crucibulum laeve]|uniref:Citrate transporter-like domain-containing protein n=1 Tax=Crucibulum laeve TaxID=68775 RepID=A0A5C3LFF7_9AGAR|nr:hypothetical protein BDQ12DRAFT_729405 [Crucibulum laeve]
MMITSSSIGTLVVFICSIIFVIYPVSFPVLIPYPKRKRVNIHVNLTTAPIIAIAILWAAQCIGPRDIRNGIVGIDGVKPYNILILFFSLAYMAITLDITGVLQAAAFWVSNKGGSNGWKLFFYFYIMLTVLSVFLGNDPVILSGTAFLVYYTKVTELEPISWLMSEFAAANTASMVLFVGNPTNVVICEGFRVNNAAFTAYTILPFLACSLTCLIALGFQFRSSKFLPRRLNNAGDLDVRSVLLDPTGAWVGSLLLGSCLVVIIVVSFFHVDVWKISLPFAAAKFIYDLAWDHYRFVNKIPMLGKHHKRQKSEEDIIEAEDELVLEELQHRKDGLLKVPIEKTASPHSSTRTDRSVTFEEDSEPLTASGIHTRVNTRQNTEDTYVDTGTQVPAPVTTLGDEKQQPPSKIRAFYTSRYAKLSTHFPTLFTALPRLPFALVPFAFSQFILIEGLSHQGWIDVFANWLVLASKREMIPTIWLVGVLGVILCNISGTNIGATILLTKVVRSSSMPDHSARAAAIALAVASNIGAVSFTFSASLAGLLWKQILEQKGIFIKQRTFAFWNALPLLVMTAVGLGVVCAEMKVLYRNA